jgi:hypothetical protein
VDQSPSGVTCMVARAATAPPRPPAPPAAPVPDVAGARLAASRSACRRSCREGIWTRRNEVDSRPGFTHSPFASRSERRASRCAECHAHVGTPLRRARVVARTRGAARYARGSPHPQVSLKIIKYSLGFRTSFPTSNQLPGTFLYPHSKRSSWEAGVVDH